MHIDSAISDQHFRLWPQPHQQLINQPLLKIYFVIGNSIDEGMDIDAHLLREGPMTSKDFLSFEKFLTPGLVRIIYWLGLVGIVISAIVAFFSAFTAYGSFRNIFGAVFMLIFGTIMWRVMCEGLILAFKTFDRLTEIRDRLPRQ